MKYSWNGVITAFMQWMATGDAADAQNYTLEQAVFPDSFISIFGAGRRIAARGRHNLRIGTLI